MFTKKFTNGSRRVHEPRFPKYFSFLLFFLGTGTCSRNFPKVPLPPQLVREPLFLHTCNEPHLGFYRGPVPHSCHVVIMCSSLRLSSSLFSPLPAPLSTFVLVQLGRRKFKERREERRLNPKPNILTHHYSKHRG